MTYSWRDYGFTGPPVIAYGDYTIKAFGSDNHIRRLAEDIRSRLEADKPLRWIIKAFWGRGKSTLCYNMAYELNELYFFGDGMEGDAFNQKREHLLSIYIQNPNKPRDLLDHVYDNGLMYPWNPFEKQTRNATEEMRKALFLRCLRKLAIKIALKAWFTTAFMDNFRIEHEECYNDFSSKFIAIGRLSTEEIIQVIDSDGADRLYSSLSVLVKSYSDTLVEELKRKQETSRFIRDSYSLTTELGNLIYPIQSDSFLRAYSSLMDFQGIQLRNFMVFREINKFVGTRLLLIFDEVEDWSQVRSSKLDDYVLNNIHASDLSMIMILRTELDNRIRGYVTKVKYYNIRGNLEELSVRDPTRPEIVEQAAGILSISRDRQFVGDRLFPFTEDVILELAKRTRRGGHFNSRMFIRSLIGILKSSLNWARNDLLLSVHDIEKFVDVITQVHLNEDLVEVASRSNAGKQEIELKKVACKELQDSILGGEIYNRATLERLKSIIARRHNVSNLSDLDIIAYTENSEARRRIASMLRVLP